jgi:hypothetical protein
MCGTRSGLSPVAAGSAWVGVARLGLIVFLGGENEWFSPRAAESERRRTRVQTEVDERAEVYPMEAALECRRSTRAT